MEQEQHHGHEAKMTKCKMRKVNGQLMMQWTDDDFTLENKSVTLNNTVLIDDAIQSTYSYMS